MWILSSAVVDLVDSVAVDNMVLAKGKASRIACGITSVETWVIASR